MATKIWVNISSGNGLLPDGTKPLPEPMLTDHQWSPVTFILGLFHNRCLNHQFHSNFPGTNEFKCGVCCSLLNTVLYSISCCTEPYYKATYFYLSFVHYYGDICNIWNGSLCNWVFNKTREQYRYRADSRFAPSQWETALLCNNVSHWLGTSLESNL